MTQDTQSPTTTEPGIDPQLKRLATALIAGAIAVILDTTIVSVGLHELGTSLHASVATIQWISTAYLLAMFVTIPLTGWAQSRLGSKRLWIIALTRSSSVRCCAPRRGAPRASSPSAPSRASGAVCSCR